MKIVLCALNSSYSHTNLAVRLLRQAVLTSVPTRGIDVEIIEGTVN